MRSRFISPFETAFDAVAFDLVDARGRTFRLLLQFRPDDVSGRAYIAAGAVVSRDSAHTVLATISCPEQWSAALVMTEESVSFFATYAPHGDVEAKDVLFSQLSPAYNAEETGVRLVNIARRNGLTDDRWVSLWATVNPPGGACEHASSSDSEVLAVGGVTHHSQTSVASTSTASTSAHHGRGRVVLEELRTLCCAAGLLCALRPDEFSMFSAYHPPAVIRSFTVAALSPVLLSVPSDVLGLIADYAWLELPYLPMSLPDEKQSEWSSLQFYRTVEDLEEEVDAEGEEGQEAFKN